ncbi:kinesin heavy chain [Pelomyxa schiedti]|nr:kinesin heavy chain [Pelomyxa schiedti]
MGDAPPAEFVHVVVRFRPQNEREKKEESTLPPGTWKFSIGADNTLSTVNQNRPAEFSFDHVFQVGTTQLEVFDITAKRCLQSAVDGYNSTVFAYGQTGAGKSWTMFGDRSKEDTKGVIPRACDFLFDVLQDNKAIKNSVCCSFLEIYREKIRDLMCPTHDNLKIRQTSDKGIYVEDAQEIFCQTKSDVLETIDQGDKMRTVAATNMNAHSSRSHSLMIIKIEQQLPDQIKKSKMIFIDLAGSEKVGKTGVEGERLEEAKTINKSLSCLGRVIKAISTKESFIPYRESVLTRILEESLRGNTKTTLFLACSPSAFNADETISTLRFGQAVKTIKMAAKTNQVRSVAFLESLLAQRTEELQAEKLYNTDLRKQLSYMESDQYDRSKPVPSQFVAIRSAKPVPTPSPATTTPSTPSTASTTPSPSPTPTATPSPTSTAATPTTSQSRVSAAQATPASTGTSTPQSKPSSTQKSAPALATTSSVITTAATAAADDDFDDNYFAHADKAPDESIECVHAKVQFDKMHADFEMEASQLVYEGEMLETTITEHKAELDTKRTAVQLQKDAVAQARLSLDRLIQENKSKQNSLKTERGKLHAKVTALQNSLRQVTEENASLQSKIVEADDNRKVFLADNERLRAQTEELARLNAQEIQSTKACEQEQTFLVEKVNEAQLKLDMLQKEKQRLGIELKRLLKHKKENKEQLNAAKATHHKLTEDVDALKKTVAQNKGDVTTVTEALQKAKAELKRLREEGHTQVSTVIAATANIKAKLVQALTLESHIMAQNLAPEEVASIQVLHNAIAVKVQEVDQLKVQIDAQESTVHALESELETQNKAVDNAEKDFQASLSESTHLQVKTVSLKKTLEQSALEEKQQSTMQALQKTHDALKKRDEAVQAELDHVTQEVAKEQTQVNNMRGEIERLKVSSEEWQSKVVVMENKVKALQESTALQQKKLQAESQAIASAKKTLASNLQHFKDLKQSIVQEKEKIRELQNVSSTLQAEINEIRGVTTKLQECVENVASRRTLAQQSVVTTSEAGAQLTNNKRRVWRPPTDTDSGILKSFQEKVDIAAAARKLRPTLYGQVVLSAARKEDSRGSCLPPPTVLKHVPSIAESVLSGATSVRINEEQLTAYEVKQYEDMFAQADKEGTGQINKQQLLDLMRSLGKEITEQEVEDLMMVVDINGNGTIDFVEFLRGMDRINQVFNGLKPTSKF